MGGGVAGARITVVVGTGLGETATVEEAIRSESQIEPEILHYEAAVRCAGEAGDAFDSGQLDKANTLAAIGQVHAALAHTAAAALAAISPLSPRETFPLEVQAWRSAIGQNRWRVPTP